MADPVSTTIRALRSTRPLLGVGARETEGDVREPHDRGPARRWLVWPAAAVCLIGLGGIAALDLSRSQRPIAAFVVAMAITAMAGAATTLLVT